jgi:hypothetical protein
MTKLNQVLAIVLGEKGRAEKALTGVYKRLQKPQLFSGLQRTYRPRDEEGVQLPPESTRVQTTVPNELALARTAKTRLLDLVATQDSANCTASADVKVDGVTVLHQVPVTTLLFLEKQLVDLHTLMETLPTLDPAVDWEYSAEAGCYKSAPTEKTRTQKVMRNHVKAEATKEHPEQVEVFTEDVVVGYWATRLFSGAIPFDDKRAMIGRVQALQDAVKTAREEANAADVSDKSIGKGVFDFVLGVTKAR